jgi:hypothetical protein
MEENEGLKSLWDKFFKRVNGRELLRLAKHTRKCSHAPVFTHRTRNINNVTLTLQFKDGIEWVAKCSSYLGFNDDEDKERCTLVETEIASLLFLQELDGVPAPRIYGYSPDLQNPAQTPYIFMEKFGGFPLHEAISNGIEREAMFRCLDGLATMRPALRDKPFTAVGSLMLWDESGEPTWALGESLINIDSYHTHYDGWRTRNYETSLEYFMAQHQLSASIGREKWSHTKLQMEQRWMVHFYIGLVLPLYVQPDILYEQNPDYSDSYSFFFTHLDLHPSSIWVDPKDGHLLGITNWEFANLLPFQAKEHYPSFLADEDGEWQEECRNIYPDGKAEFQAWRTYYAKQLEKDAELSWLNARIDAIVRFENMMMNWDRHTLEELRAVFKLLEENDVFNQPVPQALCIGSGGRDYRRSEDGAPTGRARACQRGRGMILKL